VIRKGTRISYVWEDCFPFESADESGTTSGKAELAGGKDSSAIPRWSGIFHRQFFLNRDARGKVSKSEKNLAFQEKNDGFYKIDQHLVSRHFYFSWKNGGFDQIFNVIFDFIGRK
jgi:hypothetical protein